MPLKHQSKFKIIKELLQRLSQFFCNLIQPIISNKVAENRTPDKWEMNKNAICNTLCVHSHKIENTTVCAISKTLSNLCTHTVLTSIMHLFLRLAVGIYACGKTGKWFDCCSLRNSEY